MSVNYLLDTIQSNDTPLQEAMDPLKNDTSPGGKMNGLKATDYFLLPNDPVDNKSSPGVNCGVYEIYNATGFDISYTSSNTGIGKTELYFCYYKNKQYDWLSNEKKYQMCK